MPVVDLDVPAFDADEACLGIVPFAADGCDLDMITLPDIAGWISQMLIVFDGLIPEYCQGGKTGAFGFDVSEVGFKTLHTHVDVVRAIEHGASPDVQRLTHRATHAVSIIKQESGGRGDLFDIFKALGKSR